MHVEFSGAPRPFSATNKHALTTAEISAIRRIFSHCPIARRLLNGDKGGTE